MNPERLEEILVPADATVRHVAEAIDRGAVEIALAVDENRKLIGTITDGDVRRALLAGTALDDPVADVIHRTPVTASAQLTSDALLLMMKDRGVMQIPLVEADRVVGLAFMRDLIGSIPLSVPSFVGREAEYLQECIDTEWVAGRGPFVRRFEELFASFHEQDAAVSTSSGTAALHTAMADLEIGPGDEVIGPSLTFVATVNPIRYLGATPVFADVDPLTFTLDPAGLESLITPRTRAILPVHLFGQPADMDPILEIAGRHGVPVIEDTTEALGARYKGRLCGTMGVSACFSFNGNKLITSGGGGMLLADSASRLEHLRFLTLQARDTTEPEWTHTKIGFNYTLSNLHSAVGLAQLEGLAERLARKREIADRYREGLTGIGGLTPFRQPEWAAGSFWLNPILVDEDVYGRSRDETIAMLDRVAIDSRPFFRPIHQLPPYLEFATGSYPVSDRLHASGILLPSSAGLTSDDQERVIAALRGE